MWSAACALLLSLLALPAAVAAAETERWETVPMPDGFQVFASDMEGPVFADAEGHTLYTWPVRPLRNGPAGERKNQPTCDATVYRVNAGLMSPYPPGLILPEVDSRPSCIDMFPVAQAAEDAKPVGKWTILERKDGIRQWAYEGYALYTSIFDKAPGETNGGTNRAMGETVPRKPIGPPPMVPPQFDVTTTLAGRLLTLADGHSVYVSSKDAPGKSNCDDACTQRWVPVRAPVYASDRGDFGVITRKPGIQQWTFRGYPLYTHVADERFRSQEGSDIDGWSNVYTQPAPEPPAGFTVQDTAAGQVLADAKGKTIYLYNCTDDALDQLPCDHPTTPQVYRMTVCGGGDVDRCLKTFPYVIAAADAKSDSQVWTTVDIDPKTGRFAEPGSEGSLHVWAFRDRPIYTHGRDQIPGDVLGDNWGEFYGYRNGYKPFWLREVFGR